MTTEYYPVVPFKPIELMELTPLTDVDMDLIRYSLRLQMVVVL
jgi:predicted transcriptional regulator